MGSVPVPVPPAAVELLTEKGWDTGVDRDFAVSELPPAVSVLFGRGKGAVGMAESGSAPDVKLGMPVAELVIDPNGPLPSVELSRGNVRDLVDLVNDACGELINPDALTVGNDGDFERLAPEKGALVPV